MREELAGESLAQPDIQARLERRCGLFALAALLARVLTPAARERGFTEAAIFAEWPHIVGANLASRCLPLKVEFAGGRGRHGTLVLGASAAAALELQHLSPQIIERINTFFGYPAIARLRLRQIAIPPRQRAPSKGPRALSPQQRLHLAEQLRHIGDPGLREALFQLGEAVLQSGAPAQTQP